MNLIQSKFLQKQKFRCGMFYLLVVVSVVVARIKIKINNNLFEIKKNTHIL